ncbi:unnamed protein product [Merluccius merluccius]
MRFFSDPRMEYFHTSGGSQVDSGRALAVHTPCNNSPAADPRTEPNMYQVHVAVQPSAVRSSGEVTIRDAKVSGSISTTPGRRTNQVTAEVESDQTRTCGAGVTSHDLQ